MFFFPQKEPKTQFAPKIRCIHHYTWNSLIPYLVYLSMKPYVLNPLGAWICHLFVDGRSKNISFQLLIRCLMWGIKFWFSFAWMCSAYVLLVMSGTCVLLVSSSIKKKEHLIEHIKTSYHSVHDPKCGICDKHCKSFESLREHVAGQLLC